MKYKNKVAEIDIIKYIYNNEKIDINIFRDFLINKNNMSRSLASYYINKFIKKKYITEHLIVDKEFIKKIFSL